MTRGKPRLTFVSVGKSRLVSLGALLALWSSACSVYDPGRVGQAQNSEGSAGQYAGAVVGVVTCPDDQGCAAQHGSAVCVSGTCVLSSCDQPFADCDGRTDNGCEVNLNTTQHCGMCNAVCKFSHAAAGCANGQCKLKSCDAGYGDCDGHADNGCELALTSASDCGACGHACPSAAHAAALCNAGECQTRCESGYADCNGKPQDGCEQALNDSQHCGACDVRCGGDHVEAAECKAGQCAVARCAMGFADCNHDARDGCETDLQRAGSCGSCGSACDLPHVASERCDFGGEASSCLIDRSCGDGACLQAPKAGCEPGFADCDGKPENGCETDVQRFANCGDCGVSCWAEHKVTECRDQVCVTTGCESGYGRCAQPDECQSLQEDPNNCGECGHVCPAEAPRCVGGTCSALVCERGAGDCDGNAQNGCETNLNDTEHCGGCAVRCSGLPHTRGVQCGNGRCQIGECEPGFGDCDKDPKNGCEVALNTQSDCGTCGNACARAQAQTSCEQGQCQLVMCNAGRADCNLDPSDGCEVDLSAPEHCGSCGNVCTALPNIDSAACTSPDRCEIHCKSGFADCDGQAANGCEVDLTARTSCGSCTLDCSMLPHIQGSSCVEGQCSQLVCEAGYDDCDGDKSNGCERPLNTGADCGGCNKMCSLPHAQGDCSTGSCQLVTCDSGFDNCDGDATNGCEAALTAPEHCGACNVACPAGVPCNNGMCGCAQDSECGSGEQCCGGQCVGTQGRCLPICIGGSRNQNRANCGGCGMRCELNCCDPLFN